MVEPHEFCFHLLSPLVVLDLLNSNAPKICSICHKVFSDEEKRVLAREILSHITSTLREVLQARHDAPEASEGDTQEYYDKVFATLRHAYNNCSNLVTYILPSFEELQRSYTNEINAIGKHSLKRRATFDPE